MITSSTPYTLGTAGAGGPVSVDAFGTTLGVGISTSGGAHILSNSLNFVWASQPTTISVAGGGLTLNSGINSGTFTTTFNNTSDMTFSGVLSGSGGLVKTGGGMLTLGSAGNTYSGTNTILAGTLTANSLAQLGTNASLGAITFGTSSTGILQLSGTNSISALGVALTGNGTINIPGAGDSLTITGGFGISGTGNLTKSGAGSLTINIPSTSTGGFTLSAGTLNLGAATALGAGAPTFTIAGGTLNNTSSGALTLSNNYPIAINGNFVFTGTQSLNLGAGAVTLNVTPSITVAANTLTIPGIIGGSGGLTKAGPGAMVLGSVTNTYSGDTTINGGVLTVPAVTALNATPNIRIQGASAALPATFSYTGASGILTASNIVLGVNDSANILDVPTAGANLQLLQGKNIQGGATGITALIKTGVGEFSNVTGQTSAAGTMLGDTKILNGTILSNTNGASGTNMLLGPVPNTVYVGDTQGTNNATFLIGGTGPNFANNVVVVAGSSGTATLGNNNGTTAVTYLGTVTLNKNVIVMGGSSGASSTATTTISGVISGVGGITAFNGSTSGTSVEVIALTNTSNSFTGNVTVQPGVVTTLTSILSVPSIANMGVNSALGAGTAVTMNGTLSYTGTVAAAMDRACYGLTGTGDFDFNNTGAITLTLNGVISGARSGSARRTTRSRWGRPPPSTSFSRTCGSRRRIPLPAA